MLCLLESPAHPGDAAGAARSFTPVKETYEQRLLKRARSPEDAAALTRFDGVMSVPLVLAAVLPLVVIPGDERAILAALVNIVAWLVFLVDFVEHERRLRKYLSTWLGRFDLMVVVVTAPWFIVAGPGQTKFILIIRLARLARLFMAGAGARRLFARLGSVAAVAIGIVFLGSAIAYHAEHATNPGFKTFGDSLWWGIVTLTTVGYGDIVPETTAGRFAGVMIMVTGIAVLGVLAGSLASFFRLTGSDKADSPPPAGADGLAAEVRALRESITRLSEQVAALVAQQGGPAEGQT